MKQLFLLLSIITISFTACAKSTTIERNISLLNKEKIELQTDIIKMDQELDRLNNILSEKVDSLNEDQKTYIILLEVKQDRTLGILDIEGTIKDEINKFSFPVEVSKSYYNKYKVGENIESDFRLGSFIMKGSLSSWKIKIKDKQILY